MGRIYKQFNYHKNQRVKGVTVLRITDIDIKNFKRIVHGRIVWPAGVKSLHITGGNSEGKTAITTAVIQLFCPQIAKENVRKIVNDQANQAIVSVRLDDGRILQRTTQENGQNSNGTISYKYEIIEIDGESRKKIKQEDIEGFISPDSIDPIVKQRLNDPDFWRWTRQVFDNESGDIAKLVSRNEEIKETRKEWNKDVRKFSLDTEIMHPKHEHKSNVELNEQLKALNAQKASRQQVTNDIDKLNSRLADSNNYIAEKEAQIAKLQAELQQALNLQLELSEQRDEKTEYFNTLDDPTKAIEDKEKELSYIDVNNRKALEYSTYLQSLESLKKANVEVEKLNAEISANEEKIKDILAMQKMPPEISLDFNHELVLFNGKMRQDAGGAENLICTSKIVVADISRKTDNKIKLLILNEGASLDTNTKIAFDEFLESQPDLFAMISSHVNDMPNHPGLVVVHNGFSANAKFLEKDELPESYFERKENGRN